MKKVNKELIEKLKPYWKQLNTILEGHQLEIFELEKTMEKEVGISGLEFFMCDNEYVGIGNEERTIKLIQSSELEKQ